MLTKEKILGLTKTKGKIITRDIAKPFNVSRQYASTLINELVQNGRLLKIGSTRSAFYILPEDAEKYEEIVPVHYKKTFKNVSLEEHIVLDEIERRSPLLRKLPENVHSIFTYAFSEMFNNAIEHSHSPSVQVEVSIRDGILSFAIHDSGIGVFKSVMEKKHLRSQLEAVQEILKGKTTTMPKSHSGEGIFFTSKAGDTFTLDSYGYELIINNELPDIFLRETPKIKKGTKVTFTIHTNAKHHLNDVFKKYTNTSGTDDHGFDKTEIHVKLYALGGVHISRSQARRVLAGLDKFKVIVFDYDKVPMIGQAFADEIYRVFHTKFPHIKIEETHMNEAVKFMVDRAKTEATRK